ncbi:predicted protein [Coccidioides posadasii str. Silveira]|uniref:Predicted protein n=1 Tax=Coccidioides posadasii (strain RMSCC 757 / Silveira) TaxID=443226 RepID=E9D0V0_COCPS|nr:predicted protein [Coccidioides posadasii str. Silveira]
MSLQYTVSFVDPWMMARLRRVRDGDGNGDGDGDGDGDEVQRADLKKKKKFGRRNGSGNNVLSPVSPVGEALLFSPSAIVDTTVQENGDLEFHRLGVGHLSVKIRARLTLDGGKSVLSIAADLSGPIPPERLDLLFQFFLLRIASNF